MPVTCPVCETPNSEDAPECVTCGRALLADAELEVAVQALPELEQTMLARRDIRIVPETVPGVERTPLESDPGAPLAWVPGNVELDSGREPDDGQRTPAPQDTGACPWCGLPAVDAVCENCGRRRSRYLAPAAAPEEAVATGETVLCPACFGRVASGPRCSECGLPFPVAEL